MDVVKEDIRRAAVTVLSILWTRHDEGFLNRVAESRHMPDAAFNFLGHLKF